MRAAVNSQEALARIFKGVSKEDEAEIIQKIKIVKEKYNNLISLGVHGGAQFQKFKPYFKLIYAGSMLAKDAATIAWQAYQYVD